MRGSGRPWPRRRKQEENNKAMAILEQIVHFTTGESADLLAANRILTKNEVVLESDTQRFKRGDGLTRYADLAYQGNVTSDPTSPTRIDALWLGSQAQYDALTPDANTIYFIV